MIHFLCVLGTWHPSLQTLSFGIAYSPVQLVHPAAVHQCSSLQAQRLQVQFICNILCDIVIYNKLQMTKIIKSISFFFLLDWIRHQP